MENNVSGVFPFQRQGNWDSRVSDLSKITQAKKPEWRKRETTVWSPPRILSGMKPAFPKDGAITRRRWCLQWKNSGFAIQARPCVHADTCQNREKLLSFLSLPNLVLEKVRKSLLWPEPGLGLAGAPRLVTSLSSLPMHFSTDLLLPAISGLALPWADTANGVDLGQMIWGAVWSGQTSRRLEFKTKTKLTSHHQGRSERDLNLCLRKVKS